LYYPLVLDAEGSLFHSFLGQKRNMEQENTRHDLANFTHELTPEYIKGKIEKVLSCSSGPDLFCEIFDYEHNKITADELVERYYHYHNNYDGQTAPDTGADETPANNNSENQTILEEQEKEQELSSVGQAEPYSVHSDQQTEKKEQGISNLGDYPCYYCDDRTNNKDDYERHIILRHNHCPAYPNKAELERLGLKAQGKSWEK
jgi:hypothetical protein